jgi:hypothetical protein
MQKSKRNVIGYFLSPEVQPAFSNFHKAASALREDCHFWMGVGDWVIQPQQQQNATIFFRVSRMLIPYFL